MKTKVVYCLISEPLDTYYEQLLVSVSSLRIHNPSTDVYVICDNKTKSTLTKNRQELFNLNIHLIPVSIPEGFNKIGTSRYLKTNLRHIIDDDFLFIDTDTIICNPLCEIDSFSGSIGAVNQDHIKERISASSLNNTWIKNIASKANLNIENSLHFNSGVMLVKDTTQAYELFDKWFSIYNDIYTNKRIYIDQLPLLLANNQMREAISNIPDQFNCQVISNNGIQFLNDAKIIHYIPRQNKFDELSFRSLNQCKRNGKLTEEILNIINNPINYFKDKLNSASLI